MKNYADSRHSKPHFDGVSFEILEFQSMFPRMKQAPPTLRQLAGLPSAPTPLKDSVIIIVDAQKEYTEGLFPLVGIDASITALAQFLERARSAAVPIIHVVQIGKPG